MDSSSGEPSVVRLPAARDVERAVAELAQGRLVVVVDDHDRENEADLVMSAAHATTEAVAFMVAHTTGILCVPMTGERLDALQLGAMVADSSELHGTAFTVTVDHVSTTTGVSAADRAATIRALSETSSLPSEFRRPGHVFPLRYADGGVLKRTGHTEASIDLMRLARLQEVAVISELVDLDGSMLEGERVLDFARQHGLAVVSVADIVRYRRATESLVHPIGEAAMPTEFGTFRAVAYESRHDKVEHLALIMGDVTGAANHTGVLVRVHSECLTGDALGSRRCDCGMQLNAALAEIARNGCGVLVYLRGQEGRGIGLGHKMRAYSLQDGGMDTVDANSALGLPVDSREYGVGASILSHLGVRRLRLITNNPAKYSGLEGYALEILERVALPSEETPENLAYLRTKRDRLGHHLAVSSDSGLGARGSGGATPRIATPTIPSSQ